MFGYGFHLFKMSNTENFEITRITATETYPVRHPVLRAGKPLKTCAFTGDDVSTTIHLGLFDKKRLIGVLSLMKISNDLFFQTSQYQLRGMAILKSYQGKGLGNLLINESEHILTNKNIDLVWCNARIIAVNFYIRNGYKVIGAPFEIPEIGKHYVMHKTLGQI